MINIILDNLYTGIYFTDNKGTTIYVNKTFEDISLIDKKELLGKTLQELVKEQYFTASATLLVLKTQQEAAVSYTTSTNRKLLAKGKPIFDKNHKLQWVVNTVYDLSEVSYRGHLDLSKDKTILSDKDIVAYSKEMISIIDFALNIAKVDSTVLITGESGVGKEVIATLIHKASNRKNKKLIKVNCAAIPESLIETELFGYEKGAFTGANTTGKIGLFEAANGGTIFLDEISELPFSAQAKLLSVLQDGQFMKVGSIKPIKTNVRIIAATNQNLQTLMEKNKFRKDLYYRLNVIAIHIPPLRKRIDDIEPLILYTKDRINKKYGLNKIISKSLINKLKVLPWYGNVRELENFIERILVSSKENIITENNISAFHSADKNKLTNLKELLCEYEKTIIQKALEENKTTRQLAKYLGISQASIVRKLKKYHLTITDR